MRAEAAQKKLTLKVKMEWECESCSSSHLLCFASLFPNAFYGLFTRWRRQNQRTKETLHLACQRSGF